MVLINDLDWRPRLRIMKWDPPSGEKTAKLLETAAAGFCHAAAAENFLFLGFVLDLLFLIFCWIPPGEKTLQRCWKRLQWGSFMQLLLRKPLRNAATSFKCYTRPIYTLHPKTCTARCLGKSTLSKRGAPNIRAIQAIPYFVGSPPSATSVRKWVRNAVVSFLLYTSKSQQMPKN